MMNNTLTPHVINFMHAIEQATSLDELNAMLIQTCKELAIHRFILCEFIKTPTRQSLYAMTTSHLKEWETFYQIEKEYDAIDPIYDFATHTLSPFFWTPHTFNKLTKQQNEFFIDAHIFNITSGTTFSLLPRMIKDIILPFDNEGLPPPYRHHCFFTVLDRDLTHELDLIYHLAILGNAYNLKKETFAFRQNTHTESRSNEKNTPYKLLYTILKKGILSLNEKEGLGHVLLKEIFKRGVLALTNTRK